MTQFTKNCVIFVNNRSDVSTIDLLFYLKRLQVLKGDCLPECLVSRIKRFYAAMLFVRQAEAIHTDRQSADGFFALTDPGKVFTVKGNLFLRRMAVHIV